MLAGRPLLILSGELDPNCSLGGTQLAFASAEEPYKKAHAEDRLEVMLAKGVGHSVKPELMPARVAVRAVLAVRFVPGRAAVRAGRRSAR